MSFPEFQAAIHRFFHYPPDEIEARSSCVGGYRFVKGDLLITAAPKTKTLYCHRRQGNGKFDTRSGLRLEVV